MSEILVFTDGACSNNGKINAKAGIGIYFSENDERNLSKRLDGKQSNNAAELTAIITVFEILTTEIYNNIPVRIATDSEYSIRCCTTYGKKCEEKNWKQDIPNKELVYIAYTLFKNNSNVTLQHVDAHTGKTDIFSVGNDHADKLANIAIGHTECMYNNKPSKQYLNVTYDEKDIAKQMGAKWDASKKKWYCMSDLESIKRKELVSRFGK